MNEYDVEFNLCYINTDNFKQKQIDIITKSIAESHLFPYMKFTNYGIITFADYDHKHQFPHISEVDRFSRSKINCLIYDLPISDVNDGLYDKCFIYRSNNYKEPTYGFVFYNTETHKTKHIFNIEELYDKLVIRLYQIFETMKKRKIYNYYSKKYDSLKRRNGLAIKDCPTIKDYYKLLNELY